MIIDSKQNNYLVVCEIFRVHHRSCFLSLSKKDSKCLGYPVRSFRGDKYPGTRLSLLIYTSHKKRTSLTSSFLGTICRNTCRGLPLFWLLSERSVNQCIICLFTLFPCSLMKYAVHPVGNEMEQSFPLEGFRMVSNDTHSFHLILFVDVIPCHLPELNSYRFFHGNESATFLRSSLRDV